MSDIENVNLKMNLISLLIKIKAGEWNEAHEVAQSNEGHPDYDRIHALLHRIEGDEDNAKYWYTRAKAQFPKISTEKEIDQLIKQYSKA